MDALAHVVTIIAFALVWYLCSFQIKDILSLILTSLFLLTLIVLGFPYRRALRLPRTRCTRVDERDIPFSRHYLHPDRQAEYYRRNPQNREKDERTKKLPGTSHSHAIAFLVEMEKNFTDTAPQAPVIMESYRQYLGAGLIALQVAAFLRTLGWEARAHIDANYEVICPLVARFVFHLDDLFYGRMPKKKPVPKWIGDPETD
ncbi:MAG: hypothetical protein H8D67_07705 [Deltaproteobacteria bacterium]|nr:hypothetical protein [Deltaproteobacteria bacterium]